MCKCNICLQRRGRERAPTAPAAPHRHGCTRRTVHGTIMCTGRTHQECLGFVERNAREDNLACWFGISGTLLLTGCEPDYVGYIDVVAYRAIHHID